MRAAPTDKPVFHEGENRGAVESARWIPPGARCSRERKREGFGRRVRGLCETGDISSRWIA